MRLPNSSRETKFSGTKNADRGIFIPCSADHEQDWQPYPVDPYCSYMCDHTCLLYSGTSMILQWFLFFYCYPMSTGVIKIIPGSCHSYEKLNCSFHT